MEQGARAQTAPHSLDRWLPGLVGVGLMAVYSATIATHYVVNDVLSSSLGAWRIGTTGQPWFDGFPLSDIERAPQQNLWTGLAENGHVAVFRSPGSIAAGVPAYAISGGGNTPDDFSLVPGGLTAAFLVAVSIALLLVILRRELPTHQALGSVVALALATPMWSVNANGLWTHCVTMIGIVGMTWSATRERWWLAGVFGGVALWGRLHAALVVAIFGLGLAIWRRRPAIALRIGLVSAGFMFLAAAWSNWMYGTWNPAGPYPSVTAYAGQAAEGHVWDQAVNELGLWISPDRGLLVWTPVLVILVPSLVRTWSSLPDWSRVLFVSGLAYTAVQGLMNGFTGGSTFYGYRLTLECLVCVFPAFALSARHAGRTALLALGPLLGLQFAAIAVGAISEGFLLPYDKAWVDNSYWLALRSYPLLWLWTALMLLVGGLAGAVWRQRLGPPARVSAEQRVQRV